VGPRGPTSVALVGSPRNVPQLSREGILSLEQGFSSQGLDRDSQNPKENETCRKTILGALLTSVQFRWCLPFLLLEPLVILLIMESLHSI
jgi:hypothetical protein